MKLSDVLILKREGLCLSQGKYGNQTSSGNPSEAPLEENSKDGPEETSSRDVNTLSASTDAAPEKSKHTEAYVRRGEF